MVNKNKNNSRSSFGNLIFENVKKYIIYNLDLYLKKSFENVKDDIYFKFEKRIKKEINKYFKKIISVSILIFGILILIFGLISIIVYLFKLPFFLSYLFYGFFLIIISFLIKLI